MKNKIVKRTKILDAVPVEEKQTGWLWYGNAAHLIVGRWCRFHLATVVGGGKWLVSMVGEYWPDRPVREIHADLKDPAWLKKNIGLQGEMFDSEYFDRFGYHEIGWDRTYETMVFAVIEGKFCECGCGIPIFALSELDFSGYKDARAAGEGHLRLCLEWEKRKGEKIVGI